MTTKKLSATEDLRKQLTDVEDHQAALITERDEISYLALVDRDKKSIERLNSINDELRNQTTRAETIQAALKEAVRRDTVAREEVAAEARRQNAREAEALCADAEAIAEKLDAAFAAVRQHAQEFEDVMSAIRRKLGTGPAYDHIRIFLVRALRTATVRSPLHTESISIVDQTTVSAASGSWLHNIRGHIARVLDAKTAAKKAA
jgi:dGTP triphosphohydrolase